MLSALAVSPITVLACEGLLGLQDIEYQPEAGLADAGTDGALDVDVAADGAGEAAAVDAALPEVIEAPGCVKPLICDVESSSCCESRLVPGGEFLQGCQWSPTTPCVDAYGPEHSVTISSFYLDTFEVTVARMRQFNEEYNLWRSNGNPKPGAAAHPRIADSGWRPEWDAQLPKSATSMDFELYCQNSQVPGQFWTWSSFDNDRLPINCVTWALAFAYCAWSGGRLPTEAEWEYAAVGGDENRNYAWGNQDPTPLLANYNHDGPFPEDTLTVTEVGTHPDGRGRYGHHDLAGSMYEWTLDQYSETFYGARVNDPCVDCANLGTPQDDMVQRGGSWAWSDQNLLSASRLDNAGIVTSRYSGIRCARDP
jgi:formylglycine-generating enzyme required for sulfatase activity